jgi:ATP-binding protein involved in chromosome partitioning
VPVPRSPFQRPPPADGARPARFVVAVASGKGGVGKSTVTLNLALALSQTGARTGVLDADVYGPDIPLMVNLKQTRTLTRWALWRQDRGGAVSLEPVERFGIKIMSAGLLLAEHQALMWEGQMLEFAVRQLVRQVRWGELDYLIVDLPPGTAEVQQQLLAMTQLDGAIVVVTPQDVAHLDARKLLELLNLSGVRVLGGVENMSGLACPHCGEAIEVYPHAPAERSLWGLGVPLLGRIPLDPELARAGDRGRPLLVERPDGSQADAFRRLAGAVTEALERRTAA